MKYKTFSRENDCNTMIELIKNKEEYKEISENGLVILLNGEWGSGKTTFIDELKDKIKKEDDIELFNCYNAYEYDYYDNAYVPFFASIQSKIELNRKSLKTISNIRNESKKGVVAVVYNLISKRVKKEYDIDLKNLKESLQELQEEENNRDELEHFNNVKNLKEEIRKQFNNISKEKTQVFIIDELDRCKPSFAMDTLEIVKHFFDLKNCVFIISVDKIQLEESAKSVYGIGIDGEKYFSKLFDYQFNLFPISFENIINTSNSFVIKIIDDTKEMFEFLNISIRDSKKIFNELIKKSNLLENNEQGVLLTFLLILKYTDLSFYNELFNISYIEWNNRFKNVDNQRLSKYKKALELNIGTTKLGLLLEEIILFINSNFNELKEAPDNKLIQFSNCSKNSKNVYSDISTYVYCDKNSKTIGENIKFIIG